MKRSAHLWFFIERTFSLFHAVFSLPQTQLLIFKSKSSTANDIWQDVTGIDIIWQKVRSHAKKIIWGYPGFCVIPSSFEQFHSCSWISAFTWLRKSWHVYPRSVCHCVCYRDAANDHISRHSLFMSLLIYKNKIPSGVGRFPEISLCPANSQTAPLIFKLQKTHFRHFLGILNQLVFYWETNFKSCWYKIPQTSDAGLSNSLRGEELS